MTSLVHLTSGSDSTNNPSTTASISPTSGAHVLATIAVAWTGTPTSPTCTVSGCGLTWETVGTTDYAIRRRLYVVKGTGTATSGALTITAGSSSGVWTENAWVIDEVRDPAATPFGTPYTDNEGNATVTASAVTVSETPATGDLVFYAAATEDSKTITLNGELDTNLGSATGGTDFRGLYTAYDSAPDSTPAPGISWTTGCGVGAIAFIVKAAASGATDLTLANASHAHAADNLTLTATGEVTLTLADAAHAHGIDGLTLVGFFAAVREETPNDSTYVWTVTPGSYIEFGLSAVSDPGVNTGHVIRYRARRDTAQGWITVGVYQGTTLIWEWSQELSGTETTYAHTLTEGNVANITDYSALRVRLTALAI